MISDEEGAEILIEAFEQRMNDDLDVAGAFDAVYDNLAVLPSRWGVNSPTGDAVHAVTMALEKINHGFR